MNRRDRRQECLEVMEAIEIVCADCAYRFSLSTEARQFFLDRGLKLPVRCGRCRAQRRKGGAPVAVVGHVAFVDSERGFGFLRDASHEDRAYFTLRDVKREDLPLTVGDQVQYELDDRSERPRARVIRRIETRL